MTGIKLTRLEEEGMVGQQRSGLVIMTVGKVLLWVDFILFAFVFVGVRSGSDFWVWWVVSQGILGLVLLEVGSRKRGSLTK
jgi:hypothetical protein